MWYLCLGAAFVSYIALFIIADRVSKLRNKVGAAEAREAFVFGFPDLDEDMSAPYKVCAAYWKLFLLILVISTAVYYIFPASFPRFHFAVLAVMLIWICFFTGGLLSDAKAAYRKVPDDIKRGFKALVSLSRLPSLYADILLIIYAIILLLTKTML